MELRNSGRMLKRKIWIKSEKFEGYAGMCKDPIFLLLLFLSS